MTQKQKADVEEKDHMALAAKLLSDSKSVLVLCGAGISVACGIPDFRSPGTGLYSRLQQFNLTQPTDMFSLSYFSQRPRPFYTLAEALFPDHRAPYTPSYAHWFLRLLQDHGKLTRVITQNIDGIEEQVGVKSLYQAHGSFSKRPTCVNCTYQARDADVVLAASKDKAVAHCPQCGGVLKPQIVFFGENLSNEISLFPDYVRDAETLLIMGTSLQVAPVNMLPALAVANKKNRVLINREVVGDFGLENPARKEKDAVLTGDLDEQVKKLAQKIGWENELERLHESQQDALGTTAALAAAAKAPCGLRLVGLQDSLIIPTAQVICVNEMKLQLALVTELQYTVLLSQCEKKTVRLEDREQIPSEFAFFFTQELTVFSRRVLRGDTVVYAPLGGHYSHYASKFIGLKAFETETDVWDLLTRRAGTKVGDEFQVPEPDETSGCVPLRDIEEYLEQISHGVETVEGVGLGALSWEVKETKMALDFVGDEETAQAELIFQIKFDESDAEKVQARFAEKKVMLVEGIQDALRLKGVSVALEDGSLHVKFAKECPENGQELARPVVASFFEKAGGRVARQAPK